MPHRRLFFPVVTKQCRDTAPINPATRAHLRVRQRGGREISFPRTRSDKFTVKKTLGSGTIRGRRQKSGREKKKEEDILEELCDVLPATLGPHPRVCVVVERGSHHVLLHFDAVLLALVAVIVRHVEPGKDQEGQRAESEVRLDFTNLNNTSPFAIRHLNLNK